MSGAPAISVLLPVYNNMPYLEAAVRSIMDQSFRDIEIIVVDDASTDASPQVLARLAGEDPRIHVETLAENRRLPGALNHGLDLVRAPLVARMDADDIAHPERLARQKAWMDAHPEALMVTSGVRQIDSEGRLLRPPSGWSLPPRAMRWMLRFGMPAFHPTFLFRPRAPDGTLWRYDPAWTASEDYDLLERMTRTGPVATLPEPLLDYRVHGGSITAKTDSPHLAEGAAIARRVLQSDLPADLAGDLDPYIALIYENERPSRAEAGRLAGAFARMTRLDAHRDPALGWWYRRMAARLLVTNLKAAGLPGRRILALLARHAPALLVGTALRTAENRRWIPAASAIRLEV